MADCLILNKLFTLNVSCEWSQNGSKSLCNRTSRQLRTSRQVKRGSRLLTKWSSEEDRTLVQFIGIHSDLNPSENDWPAMCADSSYWLEAAKYIKTICHTPHLRSGKVNFY